MIADDRVLVLVAALALEEFNFRRHRRNREIARLLWFALIENVGYRQLLAFWRFLAFIDLARGTTGSGDMQRKGLSGRT